MGLDWAKTTNGGQSWSGVSGYLHADYHAPTRNMAAATFRRSMYRAEMPFYSGTKSPQILENVRITPNPFLDIIRVSWSNLYAQNVQIELYDLNGKQIKTWFSGPLPTGAQHLELDGSGLPAGVYLLKMAREDGKRHCSKLVKK